ncbi:hypothetical protein GM658_19290 [Pseudoduganella eburnea]|uniref:Uncharacterized protein n=1 Tax=Massilia eburnea TaxID=1776165 RepID=A0A6L6QM24_9BURK|nr:hypothetical protein [Massilia eburnea]MTW12756.1 hypothetical protein [Massilia eburnea]
MRTAAVLALLVAIWLPAYRGPLLGGGVMVFIGAYITRSCSEDFLVQVFDDGGCLRFEREGVRISVDLGEIQELEYRDGGDGSDIVSVTYYQATPFGRLIEFYPEPVYVFDWNTEVWFADLERRVLAAKAGASS